VQTAESRRAAASWIDDHSDQALVLSPERTGSIDAVLGSPRTTPSRKVKNSSSRGSWRGASERRSPPRHFHGPGSTPGLCVQAPHVQTGDQPVTAEHFVRYEIDDLVAVITLDRPAAANAQTPGILADLDGLAACRSRSRGPGHRADDHGKELLRRS
jgi:hypothetical protein